MTLRNWSFDMMQLSSEGHIFLISAPNHTQFEGWILDLLSFQMVYSMQKIDFKKCFKSVKEDCSCFLHSVFLFSIACARVST